MSDSEEKQRPTTWNPPPGYFHNHVESCGVEGCAGIAPLTAKHVQEMIERERAKIGKPLVLEERVEYVSPEEYMLRMREEIGKP